MKKLKINLFALILTMFTLFLTNGISAQATSTLADDLDYVKKDKHFTFRTTFGLSTSEDMLKKVSEMSSANRYGIPLTAEELESMNKRETFADKYAPIIIEIIRGDKVSSSDAVFYMDNKNGGKLVVGLVKATDKNQIIRNTQIVEAIKNKIPEADFANVQFITVKYSEEDLDNQVSKISKNRKLLLESQNINITSIIADIRNGKIKIGVKDLPSTVPTFLENQYGKDLIEVVNSENPVPESRTEPYDKLYGGLRIGWTSASSLSGTTGYCTNGYSLRTNKGYFIITAGHCTSGRSSVYQGGNLKGSVYSSHLGGFADVGVIKINGDWTTNGLYTTFANGSKLTSYQAPNADYVGQIVVKSGVKTGVTSGELTTRNFSGSIGGYYYQYLRQASYYSDGGDSGAPVYNGGELRGIHTASNGTFSHIYYINQVVPDLPKTY